MKLVKVTLLELQGIVNRGTHDLDRNKSNQKYLIAYVREKIYFLCRESNPKTIVNRAPRYRESSLIFGTEKCFLQYCNYRESNPKTIVNRGTHDLDRNKSNQKYLIAYVREKIYFLCRESNPKTIVNRTPRYRESNPKTIVNRTPRYRESNPKGKCTNPYPAWLEGTYPQPANLYLIYFNPRAWARGRARIHARERQPSVRKALFAPNKVRPCSAYRLEQIGAACAAKMSAYPPLPTVVPPQPKAGLTRPDGLRWKGAAELLPSSLRSGNPYSNAANAANHLCLDFKLLVRARLGAVLAFFQCDATRYFWHPLQGDGLRPKRALRPEPRLFGGFA
ncbi:hypothetical protein [Thiosulfatimonas sediminis]|uniref:hypothetical protein n=1 Tax=Thiosulfatimonas sediminis TaxID=2675054 RepID=UPI0015644462|nr:hypothetical protein [Thiosulfatimonas sediminis]